MIRHLSRIFAAACLFGLALACGSAQACFIPTKMPSCGPFNPRTGSPLFPCTLAGPEKDNANPPLCPPVVLPGCPTGLPDTPVCSVKHCRVICGPCVPPPGTCVPKNPPTTQPEATTSSQTPEPTGLVLFGLGSLGLLYLRRRSR